MISVIVSFLFGCSYPSYGWSPSLSLLPFHIHSRAFKCPEFTVYFLIYPPSFCRCLNIDCRCLNIEILNPVGYVKQLIQQENVDIFVKLRTHKEFLKAKATHSQILMNDGHSILRWHYVQLYFIWLPMAMDITVISNFSRSSRLWSALHCLENFTGSHLIADPVIKYVHL